MSKNLSAKYYQENKERLQKKVRERYQNLFREEKEKNDNLTAEDGRQKLAEYIKKYYRMKKNVIS